MIERGYGMAKTKMKSAKVHKVSERAQEERKAREEKKTLEEKQRAIRDASRREMLGAVANALGGLLTMFSLLVGLYGILSVIALFLLAYGLKQNWDYGWRGRVIPLLCIALNVVWIFCQVGLMVSTDFRIWFNDFMSNLLGVA